MLILHGILGDCFTMTLSPRGEGLVLSPVTTAPRFALLWQTVFRGSNPDAFVGILWTSVVEFFSEGG